MEKKKFDWENAKIIMSPRRYEWLFANHVKPITEDEYVVEISKFRDNSPGRRKSTRYSPSALKNMYYRLKRNFGFFPSPNGGIKK